MKRSCEPDGITIETVLPPVTLTLWPEPARNSNAAHAPAALVAKMSTVVLKVRLALVAS